ncbi:MAG TPA: M67 family metallopeptidase [Sphingomonas sp.]
MRAEISRGLLRLLLDRAAASPGIEICGLLLGSTTHGRRLIVSAPAVANVAPDPAQRFEIDPAGLLAAYKSQRTGGWRVLGHYHSHPNGRAEPSGQDAAASAAADRLWLILGRGEARLWRERAGGPVAGAFEPVRLDITGEAGCVP